jgi:hypothetical protein
MCSLLICAKTFLLWRFVLSVEPFCVTSNNWLFAASIIQAGSFVALMRQTALFLAVLVVVFCVANSESKLNRGVGNYKWGPKGHAAVATIGQAFINSNASASLLTLLPDNNGQMPPIASWADEIRSNPLYDWSHPLHFINTPAWNCNYERKRDCIDPTYGSMYCVDSAIQNYTARILDSSIGADQQNEAIKFLVHFVGDIHQPLHCGFTKDYGGNSIKGTYESSQWNLHAIWDDAIIQTRIDNDFNGDENSWMSYLVAQVKKTAPGTIKQWENCSAAYKDPYDACSAQWGEESVKLACSNSYVEADGVTHIANGFNLGDPYYKRNLPVVESQIMKGGVRLANVLNTMWPGGSTKQ